MEADFVGKAKKFSWLTWWFICISCFRDSSVKFLGRSSKNYPGNTNLDLAEDVQIEGAMTVGLMNPAGELLSTFSSQQSHRILHDGIFNHRGVTCGKASSSQSNAAPGHSASDRNGQRNLIKEVDYMSDLGKQRYFSGV